ncbi:hypothetical protein KSP40_PGU010595 [Platanthera guangdongensis]|uniref:THUMP domain-containing protein n=1 Tax=Platanthera guangdongensis TaxID=2320717 RepID=A0ABR2M8N8_9ASPA
MAAENKPAPNINKGKKRKFLPYGKPVRKGLYPLRPGVQGFFITCDGGRERQASNEALNLLESFYEELVHGSSAKFTTISSEPVNKIIKFKDTDSSSDEDGPPAENNGAQEPEEKSKKSIENVNEKKEGVSPQREDNHVGKYAEETDCTLAKRQCLENVAPAPETVVVTKNKPIDELIEDELSELDNKNVRHFVSLDSGCNGCIFIEMHKKLVDPSPSAIAHHMISYAASTKKHMSRFILRVVPVEVTCYASEEEVSKSIKPLIEHYFPVDTPLKLLPLYFAVLYEARSNTGIERMTIINAVAKSVPQPHKVDLKTPDKTIIVQIAKTICMVGVVERYKELSKYNLRQLSSPQQ